ncbi:hypothetical protein pb186bvf_009130 [Paramecium bursaria]
MSRKPLQQEIESTKSTLSLQMSHQKTTLKEFIQFYKELNSTMKTCIEGLTKLSKKTFSCREFETPDIRSLIDELQLYSLKQGDLILSLVEQIRDIEQQVNKTYKDIKSMKENMLLKVIFD